ncbi:hypothetical protein KIN20_025849 [Parelaphostrongylus tenuis]|uniref:Uncharacterized protein n=1 Tax=Parelaphostrongylus tenuis TaxID=148309 RepID=A0AAD5MVS5_PARTN|nr:hypothetical protein KIN20_025849 [Parelaphostrongylus tenuis]
MPGESTNAKLEEQGSYDKEIISKHPDMELAQLRFLVNHPDLDKDIKKQKLDQFQAAIKENDMAPLYELLCEEIGLTVDQSLLAEMKEKNAKRLKEIDAEIEDAEKNLGGTGSSSSLVKKV